MTALPMDAPAEIRALAKAWQRAIHDRDADAVAALCAAEVSFFDLAPPLANAGVAALVTQLRGWFETKRGPIEEEIHDLRIHADAQVAFASGLTRMRATELDGSAVDLWMRTTIGCVRIEGQWRVAHHHTSVPFHMDGSLRAAVGLRP